MPLREQTSPDLDGWATPQPDRQDHTPELHSLSGDDVEARLAEVVATFGGTARAPQIEMARTVADAISDRTHLLVQGSTGTGKTLGYAVPASMAAGRLPVVLSTATKALQQQLLDTDLAALTALDPDLTVAVVKGRSEYVCRRKLAAMAVEEPLFERPVDPDEWNDLLAWAHDTDTGDRNDAPAGTSDAAWRQITVAGKECPGRRDCPFGVSCHTEQARDQAREATIVVANHHLVLHDALADRRILPDHRLLVLDEAHKLADIASSVLGAQLHPKRVTDLAAQLPDETGQPLRDRLDDAGRRLTDVLAGLPAEQPVDVTTEPVAATLEEISSAAKAASQALTAERGKLTIAGDNADRADTLERLQTLAGGLVEDLATLRATGPDMVVFVEPGRSSASLRSAPIHVAPALSALLYSPTEVDGEERDRTVIATSATIQVGDDLTATAAKLGLADHPWRQQIVASPFDYPSNALLHVPLEAPDPRSNEFDRAAWNTTLATVTAADGRSLLLFTSWTRLRATAEWLAPRLPSHITMLVQGDAPPRRLLERYIDDEHTILLGVASFWEGISAEGPTSVAVIIDKLPFPRRGDPLVDARRNAADAAGRNGFFDVDLPHASVQLAQGVGRLIRCFDPDTELLTTQGWKRHDELEVGMECYGITPASMAGGANLRGNVPKLAANPIRAIQINDTPEPMVRIKSRHTDIRVTPDHGMLVQPRAVRYHQASTKRDGREYKSTSVYRRVAPPIKKMPANEMPARGNLPLAGRLVRKPTKLHKDWFRLVGLIISDGSLSATKPTVQVHQSTAKPHIVDKIDGLMASLDLDHKRYVTERTGSSMTDPRTGKAYSRNGDMVLWQITGHDAARVRDIFHRGWRRRYSGIRAYNNRSKWTTGPDGKYRKDGWKQISERCAIPRWVFDRASWTQMLALLEGLMAGDGTWADGDPDAHNGGSYYTSDKGLADDVQELLALVGYRSHVTERRDQFQIVFTKKAMADVVLKDAMIEDGLSSSWCVTTELGNVVARRGGHTFIAGNTVDDFGVCVVLDPRLGTARYRNVLLGSLPPMRRTANLTWPGGDLPADPDSQLDVLASTPKGPPVVEWLQARLTTSGR